MQPVVEVIGPWLRNKGDALNLWSVAQRFAGCAMLAASSNLGLDQLPAQPPISRIKWAQGAGAMARAAASGAPREAARMCRDSVALSLLPRGFLSARGVVAGQDVDALVDCSGYAYGDSWSTPRMQAREAHFARLKQQNAVVVMLPQAFGPFTNRDVRTWSARLLGHCDLVFARDPASLAHLRDLGLGTDAVGLAPDITHLVEGEAPPDPAAWPRRVCLVPNARMLDRTSEAVGRGYRGFLVRAASVARALGLEPVMLVHEENDLPLAQELSAAAGELPLIDENALRSKGMIAASYAVIGSRYHAIVSALSQGVPTMGTSWSHKYEMLFQDYGCSDFLVSTDTAVDDLEATLSSFLAATTNADLRRSLSEVAVANKAKVWTMWGRIDALLGASPRQASRPRALEPA